MTSAGRRAASTLLRDLRVILAGRLRSLVVYGAHAAPDHGQAATGPVHTVAIVDAPRLMDLDGCAARAAAWTRDGLATPLLLGADEFAQSLDAFPIEFGAIIAQHEVVEGDDPFASLAVDPADLRRACEVQARAHMLHLREGYIESRGEPSAIARLVSESAAPLLSLVMNIGRVSGFAGRDPGEAAAHVQQFAGIEGSALADVVGIVDGRSLAVDGARLFPAYLAAVERLTARIDGWESRR